MKTLGSRPVRSSWTMAVLAFVWLAACDSTTKVPRPLETAPPRPTGTEPTPPSSASTTPTQAPPDAGPDASVPANPSSAPNARYPALEDACKTDADCVLFDEEITDAPPRTFTCCGGCTQRAANKEWLARFRSACEASRAPMCPPLGCAMPILKAVCAKGHCATSKK